MRLLSGLKYRHKLLAPAAIVLAAAVLATFTTLYLSRRADVVFAHVQREHLPALARSSEAHRAEALEAVEDGILEARALQRTSVFAGALLFLASAIAAAGVAAWLARAMVVPLEQLHRAATSVAAGDLTHRIDFRSEDEVGALAGAFRAMVERLRSILTALHATSGDLSSAAGSLRQLTQKQTELLEAQAWNVARTTTTTRELERASALASSRTDSVLAVARRALHVGEAGQSAAGRSLEGIGQIRDSVRSIVVRSTHLRDQARQVGEVVESVKDLATRSHVLSLNASIEASRAGESGKGFSVVAAEMRALADQSGLAAAHIGKTVEDILAAIEATLRVTDASNRGMEGSMTQIRASGESLREIGAIVQESSEAALQIADAVTQQGSGIGEIAVAMRELNAGMDATVDRIQEVEAAAASLKEMADRIGEIAHGFRV